MWDTQQTRKQIRKQTRWGWRLLAIVLLGAWPAYFYGQELFYGHKAQNLQKIQSIFARHPLPGVSVPDFFPFADEQLQEFFTHTQLDSLWEEFLRRQGQEKEVLLPAAKEVLAEMREMIQKNIVRYSDIHLDVWIQRKRSFEVLNHVKILLTVRSSGLEDTSSLKNAGGNESVPGVPLDDRAVLQALGQVLASYFSEESLGQRLQLKDDITRPIPLSAFVQVQIGETWPGVTGTGTGRGRAEEKGEAAAAADEGVAAMKRPPVSGVAFFHEAYGRTENVVQIETSYGHGELVMSGEGGKDSTFVGPVHQVRLLTRLKPERLVGHRSKKGNFKVVENAPELQVSHSLTVEQAHLIQQAVQLLREEFGHDIDMEFVLDGEQLHIVQARDALLIPEKAEYVQAEKDFPQYLAPIKNTVLVPADKSVRLARPGTEVLFAPTVQAAYREFYKILERGETRPKMVVVQEYESLNSHYGTTFDQLNIPVVQVGEGEYLELMRMQKMHGMAGGDLLFSPGQGLLTVVPEGFVPPIYEGVVEHAMPRGGSLGGGRESARAMATSTSTSTSTSTAAEIPMPWGGVGSLEELWEVWGREKGVPSEETVRGIMQLLQGRLHPVELEGIPQLEMRYRELVDKVGETLREYRMLGVPTLMQSLYMQRGMESLLMTGHEGEHLHGESLAHILQMHREIMEMISAPSPGQYVCAGDLLHFPFPKVNPDLQTLWRQFLQRVIDRHVEHPDECAQWVGLLQNYQNLGILHWWWMTDFPSQATTIPQEDLLLQLQASLQDEHSELMKQLSDKQIKLRHWRDKVKTWQDPTQWEGNAERWGIELREFTKFLGNTRWATFPPLVRSVVASLASNMVDTFDLILKNIDRSSSYSQQPPVKFAHFKYLLQQNVDFFEYLLSVAGKSSDYRAYTSRLKTVLSSLSPVGMADGGEKDKFCSQQFMLKPDFCVAPYIYGHEGEDRVLYEDRLAHLFTIIHQGEIELLGGLQQDKNSLLIEHGPTGLKEINHILNQLPTIDPGRRKDSFLHALDISERKIEMVHVVPQRCHGINFKTTYDIPTGRLRLEMNFYAQNNYWVSPAHYADPIDRMNTLLSGALLGSATSGISLTPGYRQVYQDDANSLQLSWDFSAATLGDHVKFAQQSRELGDYLRLMIALTSPADTSRCPESYLAPDGNPYQYVHTARSCGMDPPGTDLKIMEVVEQMSRINPMNGLWNELGYIKEHLDYIQQHPVLTPLAVGKFLEHGEVAPAVDLCLDVAYHFLVTKDKRYTQGTYFTCAQNFYYNPAYLEVFMQKVASDPRREFREKFVEEMLKFMWPPPFDFTDGIAVRYYTAMKRLPRENIKQMQNFIETLLPAEDKNFAREQLRSSLERVHRFWAPTISGVPEDIQWMQRLLMIPEGK